MNGDLPRQKLREIVSLFGPQVAADAEKCERLLKDCCPEHRREINALVSAIKEGVVGRLTTGEQPTNDIIRLLSKKLEEDIGLNSDLSRWAVESWGIALNLWSETHDGSTTETTVNQPSPVAGTPIVSSLADAKKRDSAIVNPIAGAQNKSKSRLKWAAGLLVTALLGSGGVFAYQKWMEKIEGQKAEEEALHQAEQAKKAAQEQVRQAALKAEEERRQLETQQENERQERGKEEEKKAKIEQQRLEHARLENQRRQLELQERQERARLDNQQRQQELRERQEQARLENQRRQQELLEKQRQLQADRQREAQERAAQQQQQRALQQGVDAIRRGIK
jgi:hypothetical protein